MGKLSISKFGGVVTVCAAIVIAPLAFAGEPRPIPTLYSTDMVEAQFAEAFDEGAVTADALPEITPFNADMVNVEKIVGDGEGVYVAVLDTGLLPPWPFFFSQANIAWELGKGFSHDVYWDPEADDGDGNFLIGPLLEDRGFITDLASGHGTHVTSTVVGYRFRTQSSNAWIRGIAPKATIIPVLVLDAWELIIPGIGVFDRVSGGTDEMISAGIRYVADLADDELAGSRVVINMSLGGSTRSPMIEAAVDYAISKGVVVVASAGNEGELGMGYPGGLPQIISAAAAGWAQALYSGWTGDVPEKTNRNDVFGNNTQYYLEDFSSRPVKALGQKHEDLDVAAPGAWVVGPYKSAFLENTNYYFLSGTSMAAPHVSAIAAMLVGSEPSLSHADVERRLRNSGHGNPLPADGAVVFYPFGDPELPPFYSASWKGGDYGTGFLQADHVVN